LIDFKQKYLPIFFPRYFDCIFITLPNNSVLTRKNDRSQFANELFFKLPPADGCAVSPGLRANNFYDNFRSFSRQNQFSLPAMQQQQQRAAQRPPAEPLPANNAATGTGSITRHTQCSENSSFDKF
jgi:hypothetical protein